MFSNVTIRPAFKEDAPHITKLSLELGYNISVEKTIENLDILERSIFDAVFVAIMNGEIVGWIQVSHITRLETGVFCEITGLVVDGRCRGGGIGKQLIRSAVKWSRGHNCATIRVRSNVLRNDAHLFYERLGFTSLKEQKVYELSIN
jgi:predicted N-acetyltransferase YhbS